MSRQNTEKLQWSSCPLRRSFYAPTLNLITSLVISSITSETGIIKLTFPTSFPSTPFWQFYSDYACSLLRRGYLYTFVSFGLGSRFARIAISLDRFLLAYQRHQSAWECIYLMRREFVI